MTRITCYEKFTDLDAKHIANNGKMRIAQINVTISYNPTSPTFEVHTVHTSHTRKKNR